MKHFLAFLLCLFPLKSFAKAPPVLNDYVLRAVSQIASTYAKRGYDLSGVLTHPIQYGPFGWIKPSMAPKTMCVSAQLEILLTALELYSQDTLDHSVFNFLPKSSWESLRSTSIKAHIWVNPSLRSYGTADALVRFGMGAYVPFEALEPGSFINFNRMNRTGHAATFLNYIDIQGNPLAQYSKAVAGFRYFSSQGNGKPDGGYDYRYAFFSNVGCPNVSLPRDCGIIRSQNPKILNSGVLFHPKNWNKARAEQTQLEAQGLADTVFDSTYLNGVTIDD